MEKSLSYYNPLKLLDLTQEVDNLNMSRLKTLRKEWMAEFELVEEVSIQIKGQEFDKQSILDLFELLEKQDDLIFFKEMLNYPRLERFLRYRNLSFFRSREARIWKDPKMVEKLMPYFAPQYAISLKEAYGKKIPYLVRKLSSLPDDIPPAWQAQLYEPCRIAVLNEWENIQKSLANVSYQIYYSDNFGPVGLQRSLCLKQLPSYFEFARRPMLNVRNQWFKGRVKYLGSWVISIGVRLLFLVVIIRLLLILL